MSALINNHQWFSYVNINKQFCSDTICKVLLRSKGGKQIAFVSIKCDMNCVIYICCRHTIHCQHVVGVNRSQCVDYFFFTLLLQYRSMYGGCMFCRPLNNARPSFPIIALFLEPASHVKFIYCKEITFISPKFSHSTGQSILYSHRVQLVPPPSCTNLKG